MECVGCQDCSKSKRKRYRKDWDSLSWGKDPGGREKEEKVKGEKEEWWKEERFCGGGGVVILQSQWRTRKEDFCEGEVLKSHFIASGFREKDKLQKEILPHSTRMTKKRTVDSAWEGPTRSSILSFQESMQWIFSHLQPSSPVSGLEEVKEGQGVKRLLSQRRQKHSSLSQDQLFIWMWFPVCQGRTRRSVVAQLWHSAPWDKSWRGRKRADRRDKRTHEEREEDCVSVGDQRSLQQRGIICGTNEGSTEESGAHWPDVGSHGGHAYFCGHAQSTVGEWWICLCISLPFVCKHNATNSKRELETHMEGIFQGSTSSLSLAHIVTYQVYYRSSL